MITQLGTWRPDLPEHHGGGPNAIRVLSCQNAIRRARRWEPTRRAAPDRNEGPLIGNNPVRAWSFRLPDDRRYVFVEGEDGVINLRRPMLAGDSVTGWSRMTNPTQTHWSMARYGSSVYATTRYSRLLEWNLDRGTGGFREVPDAPVGAKIVQAFGDFLLLANFENDPELVRWSGLNRPQEWVPALNSSDEQRLADLGAIRDIIVYEDAYLICANGIARMTFTGGDFIFQFDTILREIGVEGTGLSIGVDRSLYIGSTDGFVQVGLDGSIISRIGLSQVDDTFRTLLDERYVDKCFVFHDETTHSIRWSFPAREFRHPDTTLIYSLESRSWGIDNNPAPAVFIDSTRGLPWSSVSRAFGSTFEELADAGISSYRSPRIAGGIDVLYGFTEEGRAGPLTASSPTEIVTALFSPTPSMIRTLITAIRPWTDADVTVSIRTSERPGYGAELGEWQVCEPINPNGIANAFSSGRYCQLRFQFENVEGWIQGFEVDWQHDGVQ